MSSKPSPAAPSPEASQPNPPESTRHERRRDLRPHQAHQRRHLSSADLPSRQRPSPRRSSPPVVPPSRHSTPIRQSQTRPLRSPDAETRRQHHSPPLDQSPNPHRPAPRAPSASPTRGFLPWRLSDAGPSLQPCISARANAGVRNPSQINESLLFGVVEAARHGFRLAIVKVQTMQQRRSAPGGCSSAPRSASARRRPTACCEDIGPRTQSLKAVSCSPLRRLLLPSWPKVLSPSTPHHSQARCQLRTVSSSSNKAAATRSQLQPWSRMTMAFARRAMRCSASVRPAQCQPRLAGRHPREIRRESCRQPNPPRTSRQAICSAS